jgi:hypothetical protein
MKTSLKKKLFFIIFVLSFAVLANAQAAPLDAEGLWGSETGVDSATLADESGQAVKDPRMVIASAIRIIMGFLGIVAVIIILWGGFQWMTAGGNDDQIGEARKIIMAGVIGLLIILSAFGIATFVVENLVTATNSSI